MKKISIMIIGIFLLTFCPTLVNAMNLNVSVSCSSVTTGQTTTCRLTGSASGGEVTGISANISITGGASIESVQASSGWDVLTNSASQIYYTAGASSFTGNFTIATFNIRGNTAGNSTLTVSGIKYNDENYATLSAGTARGTINVTAPTTQPPATQAPTTKPKTTQQTAAPTTVPTTEIAVTELKLDSVKVGDFEVQYQEGKYYVTVNYDTESVEVEATANPNLTVIGGGPRTLATGKNVVELILRNEANQSATVQVIITRPEDTNDYSTYLTTLKVVDYDLNVDFNKDITEYTIYIPATVKELYIIAESDNVDVSITGDGLKTLQSGNSDIHVKVQYGDKAETNYVIHVKRSYNSVIMWGVIATLSAGLLGSILYFTSKLKKTTTESKEEKLKVMADANRAVAQSKDTVTLNGQSVVTPANTNISPIQGQVQVQNAPVAPVNESVQVVEKRVPTNPVAVATSTTNPTQQQTQTGQTQVKLVKTLERQPIKVNRTAINTNANKKVVINTGKQQ